MRDGSGLCTTSGEVANGTVSVENVVPDTAPYFPAKQANSSTHLVLCKQKYFDRQQIIFTLFVSCLFNEPR
jgi:hypothetical protein